MDPQVIIQMIGSISPYLYWLFLKLLIAFIIIKVLNEIVSNISSWFMFRMNNKINIGVKVQINGDVGVISGYDMRFIHIKTQKGDEMLIPITRWKMMSWKIKDITEDLYKIPGYDRRKKKDEV